MGVNSRNEVGSIPNNPPKSIGDLPPWERDYLFPVDAKDKPGAGGCAVGLVLLGLGALALLLAIPWVIS
jgi:hypothetical protein